MDSQAPHNVPRDDAVSEAIADLEKLIVEHSRAARGVVTYLVGAFLLLLASGTVMHLAETYMAITVVSGFDTALVKLRKVPGAQNDEPEPPISRIEEQLRPQINAIANHAKTFGGQYYSALLLSGAAVFALVFGLLMAVYRHHLTEISKLQHYKTAFTRLRVAIRTSTTPDARALALASLMDHAFDYRSGKEKVVESPAPGHPLSDASTLLLNKLLDALDATKKGKDA
ncbi:MAG TPA: hypothetical protein VI032_12840 [Burkholderiaceae bacterium]